MNRAVFLDRDGVLNALVDDPESGLPESPNHASDLVLLPEVVPPLIALHDAGFLLVVVTNQPGAAKQKTTVEELQKIQRVLAADLAARGATLDAVEMCLHHSDGSDPELTSACDCRKPAPGMLLAAAARLDIDLARSWMIGDSDTDVVAGQRAGCQTVLIEHPPSAHRRSSSVTPDAAVQDLASAVRFLLAQEGD